MVSLIDKQNFYANIKGIPKLLAFYQFINGVKIDFPERNDLAEIDLYYFDFLKFLAEEKRGEFSNLFQSFSEKKPSTESVWIHNEFLLFIIIAGVIKFDLRKEWISDVLILRSNPNAEYQRINTTFSNLLNGLYYNDNNLFQISAVFLDLLRINQLPNDKLNLLYSSLSKMGDLFEGQNQFLQIISLRSFDIIILNKESGGSKEVIELGNFKRRFEKRADLLSKTIYGIITIYIVFVGFKFIRTYPGFKEFISDIGLVLSILELGLLILIKQILKLIKMSIHSFFGFKNDLG